MHAKLHIFNILLMGLSAYLAVLWPFELFVLAYAILGPLHYLTEISWLHDRSYFTKRKSDVLFLVLPVLPSYLSTILKLPLPSSGNAVSLGVAFVCGAVAAFVTGTLRRVSLVLTGLSIFLLLNLSLPQPVALFLLFLPTITHVYVFTGFFILYGSLKERSWIGIFSFLTYILIPLGLFSYVPDASSYQVSGYFIGAAKEFEGVREALSGLFFSETSWEIATVTMRFIAFAYTYHYLNWFSKTKIIRWHEIGAERFAVLAFTYLLSLGLYALDYQFGLVVLLILSLLHVTLEFPLNFHSIAGIGRELSAIISTSRGKKTS